MPLLGEKDIGDEVADWKVGYSVHPISSPRTSFLLFFIFFFFPFLSSVLNDIVEILFTIPFFIILVANLFKITIVNYLAYHHHHHPFLIFSFSLKKDQDSLMLGPSSKYS